MHRMGSRPRTCSRPENRLYRCLHTSRRTPNGKRLWGCEHCYALCARHSGRSTPFVSTLASAFQELCCGESGSHYLLFREGDCDTMLESAYACRQGVAAASGDVVESTNYCLKKGYNGHSSRGGGAVKSAAEREAMVA